jgi:hypothetical protein
MRALAAAGHEVLHLEERKNQPTVDLLRARGSSALRAFTERYADLAYRTYELPTGLERTVWFVRQVSTADALIVLDGVPEGISEEAGRVQTRHLTKFRWSRDPEVDAPWADFELSPNASSSSVEVHPAVQAQSSSTTERSGILLVAYDDQDLADRTQQALIALNPICLTVGSVAGDPWSATSEVELPDRYRRTRLAIVTGIGDDPFAASRTWLPVASGSQSLAVTTTDHLAGLAQRVSALAASDELALLPPTVDASITAQRLVELVLQRRYARLT